jgi:holliday junction DNA helicase RuvA
MSVIAMLRGRLEEKSPESVILFAGGIGFEVLVPLSTLTRLPDVGHEVTLRTHLHVREGSLALYGFASAEEQAMFELLIDVSGVGPKYALNCLSLLKVEQLAAAIGSSDIASLQRVPGIGRKTAERIVLELRQRVAGFSASLPEGAKVSSSAALDALMFYGYSASEAAAALATVPADQDLTVEQQTLWALRHFAPNVEQRVRP